MVVGRAGQAGRTSRQDRQATSRSATSRRGRGRGYREEESCGNTWKDRVIYCYGRLVRRCVWVSGPPLGSFATL